MIRDWEPCTLSPRERRIVGAIAEALYDPSASGKLDAARGTIIHEAEAWLAAPHSALRTAIRSLLFVIDLSPIRFGFGPRSMTSLPRARRARYLATLDATGALSFGLWKSIVGIAYFGRPDGVAEMGIVGNAQILGDPDTLPAGRLRLRRPAAAAGTTVASPRMS